MLTMQRSVLPCPCTETHLALIDGAVCRVDSKTRAGEHKLDKCSYLSTTADYSVGDCTASNQQRAISVADFTDNV